MATATATAKHEYGRGDLAEPCGRCGLAFSLAHDYPHLPCTGRYGSTDAQLLFDIHPYTGDRYRERVAMLLDIPAATIRQEVRTLAAIYLAQHAA